MALFPWFSKNTKPQVTDAVDSSRLPQADATVPYHPVATERAKVAPNSAGMSSRKHERHERRDLLYAVVRDTMNRVGVLSSSYKFKVLSLDSRGRQYLVMMDLARLQPSEMGRMAEIEGMIAHGAKSRHDILVTSVYWRVIEQVSVGQGLNVVPPAPKPAYEPLKAEEVSAFKKALQSVVPDKRLSAPGEIIQSGRRNPAPMPAFEETRVDERRQSPLGATQYGDL